jgi:hypothetical protein
MFLKGFLFISSAGFAATAPAKHMLMNQIGAGAWFLG